MSSRAFRLGFMTSIPHEDYQTIFTEALFNTQRPTVALQAFFTSITGSLLTFYYPRNSIESPAKVLTSASLLAPQQIRGLVAVSGILVAHLACVAVITALFLRQTRYSAQGNYWHGVAQLFSTETQSILEEGAYITDDVPQRIAKDLKDPMVVVSESHYSGRVQVVGRDRKKR